METKCTRWNVIGGTQCLLLYVAEGKISSKISLLGKIKKLFLDEEAFYWNDMH